MTEGSGKGLIPLGTARHGPPSAKRNEAHRNRLRAARERRIWQLAELVANGWTVASAAQRLGVSQQIGSLMWRDIRDRLGEQAC